MPYKQAEVDCLCPRHPKDMFILSFTSDDAFTGGLSDPQSSQYRHRRHVFDIVNRLHSYGLQSHQMDIPQIAVVGSQGSDSKPGIDPL